MNGECGLAIHRLCACLHSLFVFPFPSLEFYRASVHRLADLPYKLLMNPREVAKISREIERDSGLDVSRDGKSRLQLPFLVVKSSCFVWPFEERG